MKIASIEDCRRIFVLTMKMIYANDTEGKPTYQLVKNRERGNFNDNSGDIVVVPSAKFNFALKRVVENVGLHAEQAESYRVMFGELAWILRPKDREHKYRKTLSDKRAFHGKPTSVYLIDRIKFDLLCEMEGIKAKAREGQIVSVAERTPDGDVVMVDGSTRPTELTVGLVQDSRYEPAKKQLDARISLKDGQI